MSPGVKNPLRHLIGVPAGILFSVTLAACSMTSHVLVGHAREPVSPEQVQVYLRPPAGYEEIALVESSSRRSFTFTAQGKTDAVMKRLKQEAASLGANGIVLESVADESAGSAGSGFANTKGSNTVASGVSTTIMLKAGSALAIYVPADTAGNP
jgi:hypothetical protein